MLLGMLISFVFATTVLASVMALMPRSDPTVLSRAAAIRRRHPTQEVLEDERERPFSERIVAPMVSAVVTQVRRRAPGGWKERARQRLISAGVEGEPDQFLGSQILTTIVFGVVGFAVFLNKLLAGNVLMFVVMVGVVAMLGWRIPEFKLSRLITRRRKAMEKSLPDVFDLLSVSVEAGLGFDGAVQKVSERFAEPVAGEFRDYLKEVRLGTSRADALRRLADRSGSADMRTFAAAIIQADQLGVSISKVLRTQAESMRVKRKQRAEEKAMQLPLKMLFPLILFIFPTLFIVILGPVAISFLGTFTATAP